VFRREFEAGNSLVDLSRSRAADVPSHVGEAVQNAADGIDVERVAGEGLSPYVREAEAGSEVRGPQGDQPDRVVAVAGQGVDVAEEEARAITPAEGGLALNERAGEQKSVLEQSGRLRLRVAAESRDIGSGGYGQAAKGEPALPVLDE
jgi:hypothetical protein